MAGDGEASPSYHPVPMHYWTFEYDGYKYRAEVYNGGVFCRYSEYAPPTGITVYIALPGNSAPGADVSTRKRLAKVFKQEREG